MAKSKTKAPKKPTPLKQLKALYPHIKSIAKENASGRPTRVIISCTYKVGDTKTGEECEGTREIATQDAFQVRRCRPCQREFTRANRRKPPVKL